MSYSDYSAQLKLQGWGYHPLLIIHLHNSNRQRQASSLINRPAGI
ncbi:Uncharacterised protein [Yersinia bercovieri]|nr:Uncharacterised protein [Yersinia bercovieri]